MANPWYHLDPRSPEVLKLLRGLDPAQELVARMALNGLCPRCRGDRTWRQRVQELQETTCRNDDDLARIMTRSREFERELRGALTEGA